MAQAKKVKKTKKTTASFNLSDAGILVASAVVIAGFLVIIIGYIQNESNIKLLLAGFGAALLLVGASILYFATTTDK